MSNVISLAEFRERGRAAIPPAPVVNEAVAAQVEPVSKGVIMVDEKGNEFFDYDVFARRALRRIVHDVLKEVEENGLPQASRLLIHFNTTMMGVEMPEWLREKYPTTMSILFDAWWEDLEVSDTGFKVTMNFGNVRTHMTVPFAAIIGFFDEGSNFALRFDRPLSAPKTA